ncbi:hypothetical protein GH5_04149 [Leishmania sp. Ghana 2012 LV757]|uniref:hypothetical protein n=1 Tax=Leishmania sp. Ghana 2012 LV757 TaxID=2803181 RepID=UPI001B3E1BFF|nr:hypothetical protein GH5_04149 [Leishmania sp. Ghana 2012 LV757]
MASEAVRALHHKGNALFEAGRFEEAARAFRDAVDRFQTDRISAKSAVDEFVKVAGNLCVCHHAMGDWHTCVETARELLAIYPIIPKAYAAIGMCIVSRLLEQEAEQRTRDSQNSPRMPPRSGEEVRRDARRYLVKLGGVVCTVDDAHKYLCRAIFLSEGALQVSLGPYVETAVRWVSEQLLSAGLSLEREYGDGVIGELSVMEEVVCDAPPLLDVAPVHIERHCLRVLSAADMNGADAGETVSKGCRPEELPGAEAEAILQAIQEGQRIARGQAAVEGEGGAADSSWPAAGNDAADTCTTAPQSSSSVGNDRSGSHAAVATPLEYFLSQQRTRVRVCHAERGGIPRGLTLARASEPFAVGQHILPAGPADLAAVAGAAVSPAGAPVALWASTQGEVGSLHVDPTSPTAAESTLSMTVVSSPLAQMGGGTRLSMEGLPTAESPPLLMCNACGREVNPLTLSDTPPTGCPTCNGVVYCSAACAAAYTDRHDRHECALRLALQRRTELLTAMPPSADPETPLPFGDVLPGGGWDALDLHRRILPLCITVYSGLRSCAPGAAEVRAQVRRGVQRRLRQALPAEIAVTLAEWVNAVEYAVTAPASPTGAPSAASLPQDDKENKRCGGQRRGCLTKAVVTASCAAAAAAAAEEQSLADHFLAIFFMVRLLAVDHAESRCNAFYVQRLLLRHSCEPNCIWSDTLRGILTARFICKGEELTMAIDDRFPQHWPWAIRQKWFVHHHGVPCQCARCLREGANLHHARGMLSNEVVEQLLTADVLGHPCPTAAYKHPTHFFHPQVQRLVEESKFPQRHQVPALLFRLHEMRAEMAKYVLPSHYLLEDIRRAVLNLLESDGHISGCTDEAQGSLLLWESLWAGAIPAKTQRLRQLPSVFECGRRRKLHPHQQRRRRRRPGPPAVAASVPAEQLQDVPPGRRGSSPSPLLVRMPTEARHGSGGYVCSAIHSLPVAGAGDGDHETSKVKRAPAATTPRALAPAPLLATKDFSGRSIIDLFYSSYQTWYM